MNSPATRFFVLACTAMILALLNSLHGNKVFTFIWFGWAALCFFLDHRQEAHRERP